MQNQLIFPVQPSGNVLLKISDANMKSDYLIAMLPLEVFSAILNEQ